MVMLMVHTTSEEHMGYGMLNAPHPHTPSLFQMKKNKNTEKSNLQQDAEMLSLIVTESHTHTRKR